MEGCLEEEAGKEMDSFPLTEVTAYFFCLYTGDSRYLWWLLYLENHLNSFVFNDKYISQEYYI